MISQQFQKLWRYNNWAWEHVLNSAQKISNEELNKERPFFWKTIYGTLAHTVGAERLWLERLNGHSPSRLYDVQDYPDLESLIEQRMQVQSKWEMYLRNLTEEQVQSQMTYQATEGTPRQNKIADIIQHVANHSTEHRSQLTPILFQLGEPTNPLDYIFYCILEEPM